MDETKTNAGDTRVVQRAQWRQIIAEQQASEKTASAFCRERSIPAWKFWSWRKELLAEEACDGGFVQMQVRAAREIPPAQVWVEAGRWRVCVAPGFDATTLRRTIEALTAS